MDDDKGVPADTRARNGWTGLETRRKALIEQAQPGALPAAPDVSQATHPRIRAKLAKR